MNEIDPDLFRLRAFEAGWMEPLKATLRRLESPQDEADVARSRLSAALLLEAKSWIEVGQREGYFPAATVEPLWSGPLPTEPYETSPDDFEPFVFMPEEFERVEIGTLDFAQALSRALDDLTPERMEFLRLLYFARNDEWESRVAGVVAFASELRRRPGASFPERIMDAVAWSLGGGDSDIESITSMPLPSDWRSRSLPARARHEQFQRRYEEFQVVRREIAAASRSISEDERTSLLLRNTSDVSVFDY